MNTQDVKEYFYRHFLGLIKVNSVSSAMAPPQILSQKRKIEAHPLQIFAKTKVTAANLFSGGGIACSSRGFRFSAQMAKVKESPIKRYAPGEIKLHKGPKIEAQARAGMKQMSLIPQERANRLQWQTLRPKKEGEVILAWFGPIVEDAVARLTLNKRRGTLLIWYNPQSRRFDVKGLYLYRRMLSKENLEWRWL